jgi:hypothetical protein
MFSTTSSGEVLSHDGGLRLYGRAEEAAANSAWLACLAISERLTDALSGRMHTTHGVPDACQHTIVPRG